MSDLMMSNDNTGTPIDAHPEGTFMAVCRDIWVERKPNQNYPGKNRWGNDEPKELVRVCIDFLTDEPIEINGQMRPRFMRFKANQSWGEKSNLRDFISKWNPGLGKMEKADLEVMVGKGAYLTITQDIGKDGKTWSNVTGIAAPPKGASIPQIPSDFVRHKFKDHPAQPLPEKHEATANGLAEAEDDGLPF